MNAKRLSYSSLLTALCVIFIFLASILPKGKSIFYILSSICILLSIWLFNIKTGFLVYLSSSILSFFIVPNKFSVVFFLIFSGFYPIVKAILEKGYKPLIEIILKYLYFNIGLIIFYFMSKLIIKEVLNFRYGIILTIISSEIIFILYDYLLTAFLLRIKSLKILEGKTNG
ncbi:hypothetical protein ACAG39_05840 [Caldicellulosiruptoraceae bacterium PP1]